MVIIEFLLIIAQSIILTYMGYNASTWEWWAIMLSTVLYGIAKLSRRK